jgi:hypothetical protein
MLGQAARAQIQRTLTKRLDDLGGPQPVSAQIARARKIRAALMARMQRPGLAEAILIALGQYAACLSAWANGAGLDGFRHPFLPLEVDHLPVSALELAVLLQEDEVGCQTGAYREHDGAVILWHAEEDVETEEGQRFDKLRLFSFRAAHGAIATGFIYPDLLPGPTFGWHGAGFIQAVDTLHVKPVDFEDGILPNTLAWLSLYLGTDVSRRELTGALGPFLGGYSLTGVAKQAGRVSVEKIEFANDHLHCSSLGEAEGDYLFQTNIINDLSLSVGSQEQTSAEGRAWNARRIARTARFMRVIQKSRHTRALILRMLQSRLGGESAYSNRDVKTYLLCQMEPGNTSIWVGAGPAMQSDELFFCQPAG